MVVHDYLVDAVAAVLPVMASGAGDVLPPTMMSVLSSRMVGLQLLLCMMLWFMMKRLLFV